MPTTSAIKQYEDLEPQADQAVREDEQVRGPVPPDEAAAEVAYADREDLRVPVLFRNEELHGVGVVTAGRCDPAVVHLSHDRSPRPG